MPHFAPACWLHSGIKGVVSLRFGACGVMAGDAMRAVLPECACVSGVADDFQKCSGERLRIAGACERYRRLGMWKKTPVIDEKPIEKFQDILVGGRVLEQGNRVKFADLVTNDFARKAK